MFKISIVMSYKDRLDLLRNTLFSVLDGTRPDEIIIVDDASDEPLSIVNVSDFMQDLNIKIVSISKKEKTWVNPCIPFNRGFKEASGDIIIIQNPESYHKGDIVKHVAKIKETDYFSYSCYSLDENSTYNNFRIKDKGAIIDGDDAWYNHPVHRPVGYHFCSAITKKNLDELGGFDERYAQRIGFDDNEFLTRIKKRGLRVKIIDNPFVLHQWHYDKIHYDSSIESNADLFRRTMNETSWKVNA